MKLRKRLTALIAASAILLSLAACGQKDPEPTPATNPDAPPPGPKGPPPPRG